MKIRVWDLPTRVFHWLMVAAFFAAFYTSRTEWLLDYHISAGCVAGGLVVFRVLWSTAGNSYARFSDFVGGWRDIVGYLTGVLRLRPEKYLGHNPAVGAMVVVMLTTIGCIVISGIITYGGEEGRGVLAGLVDFDAALYVHGFHEYIAYIMLFLVGVHITAALAHDLIFGEGIIKGMITGLKNLGPGFPAKDAPYRAWSDKVKRGSRLAVWTITSVMVVLAILYLPPWKNEGYAPASVINGEGKEVVVPPVDIWKEECAGSCHRGFHPTLLPAGSWQRVMAGLNDHFGDDASLDGESTDEILVYLLSSPAELSTTEASRRILRSLYRGEFPLRVTDTPYWKKKHEGIGEDIFKGKSISSKSNCVACHPGAEVGSFEDRDIKSPINSKRGGG